MKNLVRPDSIAAVCLLPRRSLSTQPQSRRVPGTPRHQRQGFLKAAMRF